MGEDIEQTNTDSKCGYNVNDQPCVQWSVKHIFVKV